MSIRRKIVKRALDFLASLHSQEWDMQLPIGRLLVGDFNVTKYDAVADTHRTRSCRHAVRLSNAFMASAGGNFTRPRTAAAVICSKSEACGTISTMQWLQPFGSIMKSFLMLSLPGRPRNLAC